MPAFTAALGLIPPWLWRVLAYLAIAASLFGFGWVKGDEHGTNKLTEYKAQQALVSTQAIAHHAAVTAPIVAAVTQHKQAIHDQVQKTQDAIEKNVPRGTMLSFSWRLLHDAAATGTVPDTTSGTDGPAVDAQDALDTIAGNYGSARQNAEQLAGLEEWVCKHWKIDHPNEAQDFNCPDP